MVWKATKPSVITQTPDIFIPIYNYGLRFNDSEPKIEGLDDMSIFTTSNPCASGIDDSQLLARSKKRLLCVSQEMALRSLGTDAYKLGAKTPHQRY